MNTAPAILLEPGGRYSSAGAVMNTAPASWSLEVYSSAGAVMNTAPASWSLEVYSSGAWRYTVLQEQ